MSENANIDSNYEVLERCASGYTGAVWKARQINLDRYVALKIIHELHAKAGVAHEHAKGLVKAGPHTNLVTVHGIARIRNPEKSDEAVDAVVMEWINGETLGKRISGAPFTLTEAKEICDGLIRGLKHLHDNQMVHGDLHAGNVMLVETHPKIIDINYSAAESLHVLTTFTREERRQLDLNCLGLLLVIVLRNSTIPLPHVTTIELDVRKIRSFVEAETLLGSLFETLKKDSPRHSLLAPPRLAKSRIARRSISRNRKSAEHAVRGAIDEFIAALVEVAPVHTDEPWDEVFVRALEDTKPLRREWQKLCGRIAANRHLDAAVSLHRGFRTFLEHYEPFPAADQSYRDSDFDFFRFYGHECYVTFIAELLALDQFTILKKVLDRRIYYVTRKGGKLTSFASISEYVPTFNHRNDRLKLRRMSVHADVLAARHGFSGVNGRHLKSRDFLDADFFLFLRDERWIPASSVYLEDCPRFLVEAAVKTYATELFDVLGLANRAQLRDVVARRTAVLQDTWRMGRWRIPEIPFDQIGTI